LGTSPKWAGLQGTSKTTVRFALKDTARNQTRPQEGACGGGRFFVQKLMVNCLIKRGGGADVAQSSLSWDANALKKNRSKLWVLPRLEKKKGAVPSRDAGWARNIEKKQQGEGGKKKERDSHQQIPSRLRGKKVDGPHVRNPLQKRWGGGGGKRGG